MNFAERAARNEEVFRAINEQIEQGVERHGIRGDARFHCECGRASCFEMLDISVAQYERVAAERYRFVTVPGHEDPRVERVVENHETWLAVEKIGEAREQLDRDHPQPRHRED
ncbi:MAG TPA: hypothetical protein VFA05_00605 [Gaiellaceae bacterium]|nr:hypothetical protein [Gaiellaceae bacterium]